MALVPYFQWLDMFSRKYPWPTTEWKDGSKHDGAQYACKNGKMKVHARNQGKMGHRSQGEFVDPLVLDPSCALGIPELQARLVFRNCRE